jgi:hypothetical protein
VTKRSDLAEEWRQAFAAANPGKPVPEPSDEDLLAYIAKDWTVDNVARLLDHVWAGLTPAQRLYMRSRLEELARDAEEGRASPAACNERRSRGDLSCRAKRSPAFWSRRATTPRSPACPAR